MSHGPTLEIHLQIRPSTGGSSPPTVLGGGSTDSAMLRMAAYSVSGLCLWWRATTVTMSSTGKTCRAVVRLVLSTRQTEIDAVQSDKICATHGILCGREPESTISSMELQPTGCW